MLKLTNIQPNNIKLTKNEEANIRGGSRLIDLLCLKDSRFCVPQPSRLTKYNIFAEY